ncbi:Uncharacterized protein Fot_21522 [Forsythia ovata]|uniref:Uncharacterized protein n=1 Tax=Forsythia ovata TaxID=205694 RepID=A0ABD1UVG4_9LAMI
MAATFPVSSSLASSSSANVTMFKECGFPIMLLHAAICDFLISRISLRTQEEDKNMHWPKQSLHWRSYGEKLKAQKKPYPSLRNLWINFDDLSMQEIEIVRGFHQSSENSKPNYE